MLQEVVLAKVSSKVGAQGKPPPQGSQLLPPIKYIFNVKSEFPINQFN